MRELTRVSAILIGVIGTTAAGSFTIGACSSSSSAGAADGSTADAAADHATHPADAGAKADAKHDVTTQPDAVGTPDAVGGPDVTSTPDVSIVDAGADVTNDAAVDSTPDVGVDSSAAAAAFPRDVVVAYCTKLASCCGEGPDVFSVTQCTSALYDAPNFIPSQLALILRGLTSSGHAFNPTQAAACTTAISSMTCGASAASAWHQLAETCTGAYSGQIAASHTGCLSSFDCTAGNYCAPLDSTGNTVVPDGGGTCTPLAGANQPCVDIQNSSDCTYLGLGSPALFCNNYNADAGVSTDGGVCTASQATGTACNIPGWAQQCTSQQCLPTVDGGFLSYDYGCQDSAGFTQIEGVPQCLLYPPVDGG